MPKVVTGKKGDTLCGIGIDNGFLDCTLIREANKGADFLTRPLKDGDKVTVPDITVVTSSGSTTTTATFVKKSAPPVSIKIVHGSADQPYLSDKTWDPLPVSRYQVDLGVVQPPAAAAPKFPDAFEFHKEADGDPATFKVQIVDPAAGGSVTAILEALKPVYKPDGKVDHHELFKGAEYDRRKLTVQCDKVKSGVAYRSKYLRLVVDDADKKGVFAANAPGGFPPDASASAKPDQTLLVTDMVDEGEPNVEILDQKVRASYELQNCPGSPKCRVTTEANVGRDPKRLRIVINILRSAPAPGGAPLVQIADAERRVRRWMRRVLAQSNLSPKIVSSRIVDPPSNFVTIADPLPLAPANGGGSNASGVTAGGVPSNMGFTVTAGADTQTVGPIVIPAHSTPAKTAALLAGAVTAPFSASVSRNPRRLNDAQGCADILIKHTGGTAVTVSAPVATDTAQTLRIVNLNPLPNPVQATDGGVDSLLGSRHERAIVKNYHQGTDKLNLFVVQTFHDGCRGEAFLRGPGMTADPKAFGAPDMKLAYFMIQSAMDSTDNDPLVITHELIHATAEVGHATTAGTELMFANVTGTNAPGSTKHLADFAVTYANPVGLTKINLRIRAQAAGQLESW